MLSTISLQFFFKILCNLYAVIDDTYPFRSHRPNDDNIHFLILIMIFSLNLSLIFPCNRSCVAISYLREVSGINFQITIQFSVHFAQQI